jgi:hypothetical protein
MSKKISFKVKAKYVFELLFKRQSAYELGKKATRNKLTTIRTYKYCQNKNGELAIYQ